ncbi:AraC family transcriptional regulator [Thioalkalivibrio denitrificans]|uniref:AraC family transcriptional regulator n=1 Tax=Thioalkalivibrio denitrificans TaxID=108003 RepID=A0A1V3NFH6_9GAMM|nr:DJ-1/PfpI family protein [Thioalkalivibrio denitrificans]OOG23628.1 AraC family transcriptional regulator [Thioalkalivibrio denitrificans]
MQTNVGILIFENVEVLDFCGPYEVFVTTRLDESRRRETEAPYKVSLLAATAEPVTCSGGMRVLPTHTLADAPAQDILVVPGGWGVRALLDDAPLMEWLREQAGQVKTLASVCTGSLLLASAGLLDGREATTHWRSLPLMKERFPQVGVHEDVHVVEDGNIISSAGISAGMDLALRIVARDHGDEVAANAARNMEYPWPSDNRRRVVF